MLTRVIEAMLLGQLHRPKSKGQGARAPNFGALYVCRDRLTVS